MLKQVGIRLEEELIMKLKVHALENSESMQEVITKALEQYLVPSTSEAKPVKLHTLKFTEQEIQSINSLVSSMRIQLHDQKVKNDG